MAEVQSITEDRFKMGKIVAIITYFALLVAYAIILIIFNDKGSRFVGIINIIVLVVTDLMMLQMEVVSGVNSWIKEDWFKCTYYFFTRFMCCFLVKYWLSMHSLTFLVTSLIMGCNFTEKVIVMKRG